MSELAAVYGASGPLSAGLPADLGGLERMLLAARGELARVLLRVQRRAITAAQYAELVAWAGYLRVQRGLTEATGGNYVEALALFAEWLAGAGVGLDDVDASHVDAWHKALAMDRQAERTRGLKLSAVRSYYDWRELHGRGHNPARVVPGPRRRERVPRKYSTAQLRSLFAAPDRETVIGRRDYAVLLLAYATGARRMELAGLELDQLELRQRVGSVRWRGKGVKERRVGFEGAAVEALVAWLADREQVGGPDPSAVFVGLGGPRPGTRLGPSGLDDVVYRALKRSRLRVEPGMALHTLRVTFATDLYDRGVDLETIRHIMGHNQIETTRGYLAISERRLRTRMPSARLGELTGGQAHGTPLWVRQRQRGFFDAE